MGDLVEMFNFTQEKGCTHMLISYDSYKWVWLK